MRLLIILTLVLPLLTLHGQTLYAQFGPANVIVAEVIERPVAPKQSFVATVVPLRKSIVGTAVAGRVDEFLLDADAPDTKLTFVKSGQVLAHLREGTMNIKIKVATAQHKLRYAEWDEAKKNHPGLVAQAEAKLKAATENMQFAKNQFERNRALYENSRSISISLEQFEESRNTFYNAEQEYVTAKITEVYVKRGDRIAQAEARLEEAQANLDDLNDRLAKYTIKAPFDGFVVAEHTEQGEWVQEGDPIAEIVQLHPVEVRAFVPEKYIGQLAIGGSALVKTNAGGASATGRITGVVAEAVTRSRTFPVKIQVENENYSFKAGMLAEVNLEIGSKKPATLIPKDALVLGGQTPRIFLAIPDPKDESKFIAKMMPVKPATALGDWIAVTAIADEILAGDLVIEKGNERLRPGAPLIVNRDGATPPPAE